MSQESKATEKGTGTVEAIYVTSSAGNAMQPLQEAEAIAGQGIAGDRYLSGTGYYSNRPLPDGSRQITLIETEELERLQRESGIRLDPAESRRNILTRFISVNDLIGERFRVGDILCEGIRICEPCTYLEKLTGKRVMRPLVHRGGLRARIVSGGTIRIGDELRHSPEENVEEADQETGSVHTPEAQHIGEVDPAEVQAEGVVMKLQFSFRGEGTHYLESADAEPWALVSEELHLDDFLGIEVKVLGYEVQSEFTSTSGRRLMNAFLVTSV